VQLGGLRTFCRARLGAAEHQTPSVRDLGEKSVLEAPDESAGLGACALRPATPLWIEWVGQSSVIE